MGTTRCDCRQLSFLSLRSYARRYAIASLDELIRRTGCCTGCGTCRPDLEEFLRTGEVRYGDQRIRLPEPESSNTDGVERAQTPAAARPGRAAPPAELD